MIGGAEKGSIEMKVDPEAKDEAVVGQAVNQGEKRSRARQPEEEKE